MTRDFPRLALVLAICAALPALAQTNPLYRFAQPSPAAMNGVWNGVDLERRAGCANPQLTSSERCAIEAILSMARLPP